MQVGTTKDQCLYNKPSAAVHPGALVAGTLPQYNTIYKSQAVSVLPRRRLFMYLLKGTMGPGERSLV